MTGPSRTFGAALLGAGRTRFRLWAPDAEAVAVEVDGTAPAPMSPEAEGWFAAELPCDAGTAYRYRVAADLTVPDPAARRQLGDASVVTDPAGYLWRNPDWSGRPWHEAVIYELHAGVLGGFAGVTDRLAHIAGLGATAIELMPIGDFPGPRNWGYDGVLPYAPDAAYGSPEELKRLIDTAHGLGLMVLLDVVYNHFGPEGNHLGAYAKQFHRHDRQTPWGDAIDFRRPQVRRFFVENALAWLDEYRFDGLRFDAVHAIGDDGFLREMAAEIRATFGASRYVHLVLENEAQQATLLRGAADAAGFDAPLFDAQWADDLHHCVHVLLTGETEGHYRDYLDAPAARLARCLREGFDYQGEPSVHGGGRRRGTPSAHLPTSCFVICLQNHDQVGNRACGERLTALAPAAGLRAATVLLLLAPQIPLLFMGQEWGASAPFLYFTSFEGPLADAVRQGRRREFAAFAAFSDPASRDRIPDPNDPATFAASTPDFDEITAPGHAEWLELHRRLLALRHAEITPRIPGTRALSAQPLGETGVHARWRLRDGAVLAIAANLGTADLACPRLEGRVLFAIGLAGPDRLGPYAALASLREPPG